MKLPTFRDPALDYGRRLSLPQKLRLGIKTLLARETRWQKAARAWLDETPGRREKVMAATLLIEERPAAVSPFPFVAGPPDPAPRIGVACHLFYDDLAGSIAESLSAIPIPFDMVVTTDTPAKKARIEAAMAGLPRAAIEVRVVPNKGRDIAPKVVGAADLHARCDLILHIHGKKSLHNSAFGGWRGHIFDHLLGDAANVNSLLHVFATRPDIGMIGPAPYGEAGRIRVGPSSAYAAGLLRAMGAELDPFAPLDHPVGSMFWARTSALKPLLDLKLTFDDFGAELRQQNGTLAHAIERSYGLIAHLGGGRLVRFARQAGPQAAVPADQAALDAMIDAALAAAPAPALISSRP